ncbi:FAD-binding protein, partial [Providencia manganoxydans]
MNSRQLFQFSLEQWRSAVQTFNADIAIIGAGGAGLRAAIAAAEANPQLKIALISKVYPMRSHTVAAEGGSAAV